MESQWRRLDEGEAKLTCVKSETHKTLTKTATKSHTHSSFVSLFPLLQSFQFYLGTVYNYNRKMKKHQILYDDGDKGYVNLDPSRSLPTPRPQARANEGATASSGDHALVGVLSPYEVGGL